MADDDNKPVIETAPTDAIFGSYCRTRAFMPDASAGLYYEYEETYRSDAYKGMWVVQLVTVRPQNTIDGRIMPETTTAAVLGKDLSFPDAVATLSNYEIYCSDPRFSHQPVGKTVEEIGDDHYLVFAEREGFIFDELHKPHKRPNAKAFPAGANFTKEDVERANARVIPEVFSKPHPSPFIKEGVLADLFKSAAGQRNPEQIAKHILLMKELDSFVSYLMDTKDKLDTYIHEYKQFDKGKLVDQAIARLEETYQGPLKNMSAMGVDVKTYCDLVEQMKVACTVIRAKGVFNLRNNPKADAEAILEEYKVVSARAVKMHKKLGASKEDIKKTEAELARGGEPFIPKSFTDYIENYKIVRAEIKRKLDAGEPINEKQFIRPTP